MGDPCYETMGGHLMIEQIDLVDKLYVLRAVISSWSN
jgi:hypothetical protein